MPRTGAGGRPAARGLAWLRSNGTVLGPGQSPAQQRCAVVALVTWSLVAFLGLHLLAGGLTGHYLPAPVSGGVLLLVYGLFALRLFLAAPVWPDRRHGTLTLAASMVFVTIGAAMAGAASSTTHRTSPLAFLVLSCYQVGMVVFIVLDGASRRKVRLAPVLDAVVLCGGAVGVAGALVLSPLSDDFSGLQGSDLAGTLLFPAVNAALLLAVLGEAAAQRRAWSAATGCLIAGLVAMAGGSILLLAHDEGSDRVYTPDTMFVWTLGLSLIVTAACGPKRVPRASGTGTAVPILLGGSAAGIVLALENMGSSAFLVWTALLTLVAILGRMALAIREAQGATEAYRLSRTDELTGLPNRRAVLARIDEADAADERLGLLLFDLDRFKIVNDTLGHLAGDTLLRMIARRLVELAPAHLLLARLGGDEFAVAMPVTDDDDAAERAARLREVIAEPLTILGHELALGCSVGVSVREPGTVAGEDLLRQADVAMYQAKAQRSGVQRYHPEADDFTTDDLRTAALLRRGLPGGQIQVWYQPQVDARTHALAGLEALVRWEHPELGIRHPGQFLEVARQSGLMPALTEIILDTVLDDVRRMHRAGIRARASFNVAPAELLDAKLVQRLLAAIERAQLARGTLTLEVTEDSLLADPERAAATLSAVSRHGVEIAIDDYGAGFSSLAYLRDLPVHELKMDRSFITRVAHEPRSRTIVASTRQLAHGLGLRTVAEGVEDAAGAECLADLGVDLLQGFHFARPMPFAQLHQWILARPAPAAAPAPSPFAEPEYRP